MSVDINKIKVGDPVIVKTGDIEDFKTYNFEKHYPGYNESMEKYSGTIGVIKTINPNNNIIGLSFVDGEYWTYLLEWISYFKDGIQELEICEPPFKIGDTVFIGDVGGWGKKGREAREGYGKITYIHKNSIGVCHYMSSGSFHTCSGTCPDFYGWFYNLEDLELSEFKFPELPIN